MRRLFSIQSLGFAFEESRFDKYQRQLREKNTQKSIWSFKGIEEKEPNIRFLADRMMLVNKISIHQMISDFYSQFSEILECIGKMDISPVKDLIEPRLYSNLNLDFAMLKSESKNLSLVVDPEFADAKPTVNIVDSLVYRGLSTDRDSNKSISDYHVFFDESIGIACFTDNLLSDPMGYLNQQGMEELHAKNRLTLVQFLVWVKSPFMLKVHKDGKEITEYIEYTHNQQWVFESQCIQPQWMKKEEKNESYLEWIGKFKPEKFRVADMNDFLNLNPLVSKKV